MDKDQITLVEMNWLSRYLITNKNHWIVISNDWNMFENRMSDSWLTSFFTKGYVESVAWEHKNSSNIITITPGRLDRFSSILNTSKSSCSSPMNWQTFGRTRLAHSGGPFEFTRLDQFEYTILTTSKSGLDRDGRGHHHHYVKLS